MERAFQPFRLIAVFLATLIIGWSTAASAEPTDITIRVISRGGAFIGSPVGGARVILRDANTGELLARGVTEGSPGDVQLIMQAPRNPSSVIATEKAAKFEVTLDLVRPRLVEVTAIGPLAQEQAANRVSVTQWVVPGRDLSGGNGWLLVLPGLLVDVEAPVSPATLAGGPAEVALQASVTMMCGCPIQPGGFWEPSRFRVAALVYSDGALVAEQPLGYAGKPSRFAGRVRVSEPGTYEVVVYAYDPRNGNTGLDRLTFVVEAGVAGSVAEPPDPAAIAAALASCGVKVAPPHQPAKGMSVLSSGAPADP